MWSSSSCWSLLVTAFNEQLLPWSMVTHWRAREAQRAHPSVVKHVPSPCGSRLFTDDRVDRPAITRKNHSRKQSGTALISLLQFRCTLLHSAFGCSLQAEVPFGFRGLRASGNKLPRTEIFCRRRTSRGWPPPQDRFGEREPRAKWHLTSDRRHFLRVS